MVVSRRGRQQRYRLRQHRLHWLRGAQTEGSWGSHVRDIGVEQAAREPAIYVLELSHVQLDRLQTMLKASWHSSDAQRTHGDTCVTPAPHT